MADTSLQEGLAEFGVKTVALETDETRLLVSVPNGTLGVWPADYAATFLDFLRRIRSEAPAPLVGGGEEQGSSSSEIAVEGTKAFDPEGPRSDGWRDLDSAPKDGTRVLMWTVHANAKYSTDPVREGWAQPTIAHWIDHNGGGWTWHGLAGEHIAWMPLPETGQRSALAAEHSPPEPAARSDRSTDDR